MKNTRNRLLILLVLLLGIAPVMSEPQDEPLFDKLEKNFKKDYLSLGFVLQVVGDGQIERSFPGNNGYNISNMRFAVYGNLDKNFGYLLRVNFINSFSLLDARMSYRFSPAFIMDVGLFKAPFSREFLTPAESIDFVNRSLVVAVLAPNRQIGMQARGEIGSPRFTYSAGIFNGNGFVGNNNDNNDFMVSGRLAAFPFKLSKESAQQLEIGVNVATSNDAAARISEQLNPFVIEPLFFNGKRTLVGADVRYTRDKILLAAEYIYGDFDGTFTFLNSGGPLGSAKPSGYHLTAGYMMKPNVQLLGRFDSFEADNENVDTNLIIFGLNYWPTKVTELQVNYTINTGQSAFKHHQLLINAQVAF